MSAQPDILTLSPEQKATYRLRMERDPWYFFKHICHYADKAVERVDRPFLYAYTLQAELLAATLSDPKYDGPVTDAIRADFVKRGIDWTNPAHMPKVKRRLRRQNWRLPRGWSKSTNADAGDLWMITVDPDLTVSLGTKADTYAWERIDAMGKIIMSPEYGFFFPDRIPAVPKEDVTKTGILLNGRRLPKPEGSIEGRGINSPWTGRHYRRNRRDDIVGTESGDASVDDAHRHMANMTALRDLTGWVGDVFIGTINGENDDHAILAGDDDVMSIVIPIEEHEGGTTLENIYTHGTLMCPEKFSRETVDLIKSEAKANPLHGPIYLLQNYYMAAHKSGTSMFSLRMIERAKFTWHYDERIKREVILRPKKEHKDTQRDPTKPGYNPQHWTAVDLKKLPRSAFAIGIDQSVREDGSGDEWAMALVAIDSDGVYYVLDCIAEHGYENLLSQIIPFDKKCGNPWRIGVDSNATQGMTIEWLKRTKEFTSIARRVVPVKSGAAKDLNIRNWMQGRMLTGELYISPRLDRYIAEMLRYKPRTVDGRKKKNAIDNKLDATWMAMTLPIRPMSQEEETEIEMDAMLGQVLARRNNQVPDVLNENWFSIQQRGAA